MRVRARDPYLRRPRRLVVVSARRSLISSTLGALLIRLVQAFCLVVLAWFTLQTLTNTNHGLTYFMERARPN